MRATGRWLICLALCGEACARDRTEPRDVRESAYQLNNRGVAQLEQYSYDAAAQSFRGALAIDNRVVLPHINLAIALYYASNMEEAAAAAAEARRRQPDSPQAVFIQGLIARGQNRAADAAAAFSRVLELDPGDAGAMINLGQVHAQERRETDAIALFRAAVALEPANATALYSLGQVLMRSGARAEGARVLEDFGRVRESGAAITYSQTYLEQGRYAEAVASTGLEPDLVDAAVPDVRFSDQTGSWAAAATGVGAVTLADIDGDGDLELITGRARGIEVWPWDAGRFGEPAAPIGAGGDGNEGLVGIVAADLDNDERPDLLALHTRGFSIHQQSSSGGFTLFPSRTARRQAPRYASEATFRTAAMLDVDHDGDLDVLAGGPGASATSSTLRLFRNDGEGALTEVTAAAQLHAAGAPLALVPTDYDNRRDIDILVLVEGRAPSLFQNRRDGSFRDVSRDVGLGPWVGGVAVAAGDLNKDGYTDFVAAKGPARAEVAFSDGRGRFALTPGPEGSEGLTAVQSADYDNDGLLDLIGTGANGLRVFRNLGGRFADVPTAAISGVGALGAFVLGDIDSDGDSDIAALTSDGTLRFFRNDGAERRPSLRVRLRGRVSNRTAVGAKVDVRAGSLWQRFEPAAVAPPVAGQDLIAGLGRHAAADAVRVLWPAGIVQAETTLTPRTVVITELNRKPSSCPFLYVWNGTSFEFATDFLGAGELGYWTGAHGWSVPDGDEYVRLTDRQLVPRLGRLELRVTNELEEVLYLDHLQLLSIDHPADVQVFPREGMRATPRTGLSLTAVRNVRPLARVAGDGFVPRSVRGYADPHAIVLDPGEVPRDGGAQVLLLTGRTDYAFSSDNVAASQRGWTLDPPRLEIRTRGGPWRPFAADVGIPVGRPQTIIVDIGTTAREAGTEFRLITNMQIRWDALAVADLAPDVTLEPRSHAVAMATLRFRGYSAQGEAPDYAQVSRESPWKVFPGRYTREGDVRALLSAADDLLVVARTGDEVALAFASRQEPAAPAGARTFLLRAEGYSKEMDLNSSSPDHVLPLPYRGLTAYPSVSPSAAVRARQRALLERDNTRVVSRPFPASGGLRP